MVEQERHIGQELDLIARHRQITPDPVVAAAIQGDRSAIATLWERHRRWVAAVLLTYKPPGADLEDLLQEVAMRLLGKISTLREEANVRAWLRAVAVNVARSAGRSARVSREVPTDETTLIGADVGPAPLDEQSARLLAMVARLPEHYREPLMLRAVNGMRTKQIAEVLEVPPATIDTRIARARRMLREQLEAIEPGVES
jgi:RNA polymerase sigma-70 factor (ECF subfamily)